MNLATYWEQQADKIEHDVLWALAWIVFQKRKEVHGFLKMDVVIRMEGERTEGEDGLFAR